MNRFFKVSLLFAMMACPAMADESFGGVGITIYQVREGVHVAEVIPGTPAAETNLRAGDIITSVDGISLSGQDIEFSKAKLRGQVNKPLEITYKSEGEIYTATLRRAQITVKDLDNKAVSAWYGEKSELNAHELETFASANENSKQLVAVLNRGNLVKNEIEISHADFNGVYVEKVDEFAPKVKVNNVVRNGNASLRGFDRTSITYAVKTPGKSIVTIMNADGEQVAKLVNETSRVGVNTVGFNAENIPNGRYMISIEHNGSVSGKMAVLK